MRWLIVVLVVCQLSGVAQQKKATRSAKGKKPVAAKVDSSQVETSDPSDTLDPRDLDHLAWRDFAVYNKRGTGKDRRLKLCYQLPSDSAVLNICVNDSSIRDPEVYKELFRKSEGDSTWVLLYIDAFSKVTYKLCDGGHETRLVFFKWNTKTNKARFQQRTVASCIKAITNMGSSDVNNWDGKTPLKFSYHRGGTKFLEVMFDPSSYKRGLQYVHDDEDEEG